METCEPCKTDILGNQLPPSPIDACNVINKDFNSAIIISYCCNILGESSLILNLVKV